MKLEIKFALIAVVAAISVGCTAKTLPPQSPLSVSPLRFSQGEVRVPDQVIVITDASGTMYQHKTFPQAKALTSSFVAAMPDRDSPGRRAGGYDAGLISFGGAERITAPLAPFDRGALASKVETYRILGELGGYGGNTPYHDVLTEARGSLTGKSQNAAVVVFSDGLPDDEMEALRAARNIGLAYSGKVCIHTVQTGTDPKGADLLKRLSKVTGCGTARTADSVSDPTAFMNFVRVVFLGKGTPQVDACSGIIRLRGVEFEFNKADLTAVSSVVLDAAAESLLLCPNVPVRVEGNTDSIGTEEYNQDLGLRRAQSVRNYLVGAGVNSGRIRALSHGETRPIATNDTDEGRALNRRVELHAEQ